MMTIKKCDKIAFLKKKITINTKTKVQLRKQFYFLQKNLFLKKCRLLLKAKKVQNQKKKKLREKSTQNPIYLTTHLIFVVNIFLFNNIISKI